MLTKLLKVVALGAGSLILLSACGETPQANSATTTAVPVVPVAVAPEPPPPVPVDPLEEFWDFWVKEVPTSYGRKVHTLTLVSNENGKFFQSETTCYFKVGPNSFQLKSASAFAPIAVIPGASFYSLAGTETDAETYVDDNGTVHKCEAAIRSGQYRLTLDQDDKMWVEQPQGNAAGVPSGPYWRNEL
ncbi:MAG: hypothetical protein R3B54_01960 [Bdellovibrionota bacterium]